MNNSRMASIGGWSLIAFALLFLGLQLAMILFYNFPATLTGPDRDTFPLMLAGGPVMQFLLSIYALLPLLLIPASVGAYYAFRDVNEPGMRIGVLFATLAAFVLTLALLRWPSFNWYLARYYGGADAGQKEVVSVMFHSLDSFLGVFVGSFLGKICITIWFFIVSASVLRTRDVPAWIGYLGYIASVYLLLLLLLSPFNIIPVFAHRYLQVLSPIEFIWLMVFGVVLLYYKEVR